MTTQLYWPSDRLKLPPTAGLPAAAFSSAVSPPPLTLLSPAAPAAFGLVIGWNTRALTCCVLDVVYDANEQQSETKPRAPDTIPQALNAIPSPFLIPSSSNPSYKRL